MTESWVVCDIIKTKSVYIMRVKFFDDNKAKHKINSLEIISQVCLNSKNFLCCFDGRGVFKACVMFG